VGTNNLARGLGGGEIDFVVMSQSAEKEKKIVTMKIVKFRPEGRVGKEMGED